MNGSMITLTLLAIFTVIKNVLNFCILTEIPLREEQLPSSP